MPAAFRKQIRAETSAESFRAQLSSLWLSLKPAFKKKFLTPRTDRSHASRRNRFFFFLSFKSIYLFILNDFGRGTSTARLFPAKNQEHNSRIAEQGSLCPRTEIHTQIRPASARVRFSGVFSRTKRRESGRSPAL